MIYESREPTSESALSKQSTGYGFSSYPPAKTFMELSSQYSSEYTTAMTQGYEQPHYFSTSIFAAPALGQAEEQYTLQTTGSSAEPAEYSYEKKEPKCICKQNHNRIPRPRNAFILFRQRYHRSVFDESSESKTNPQVSQELGRRWRALSVKERDHWNNLAEEERQQHAKKYPNYRYTPRRKGKYKHCQVCYGKKDNRAAPRQVKRITSGKPMVSAHQAAASAKAPVAQLSQYHFQYQQQTDPLGKMALSSDMYGGLGQSHLSAQTTLSQPTQSRVSTRTSSHAPLDGFQYMSFAQTMYPPLNQYGYLDNSYLSGTHTQGVSGVQAGSAMPMHSASVSRRSSIFARSGSNLEYDSSQANDIRTQPAGVASGSGAASAESYPLPTSMQQYLVSFNKTALRKVS